MSVETNATSSKRPERTNNNKRIKYKLSNSDGKDEYFKNASNMLSYDVLRVIFSYLPAKDLCCCSQVCRLWRDVATFELSIRKVVIRFEAYNDLIKKHNSNKTFEQSIRNKPMFSLFCFAGASLKCLSKSINKYFPSNCHSIGINVSGLVVENKEYESDGIFSSYLLLPDDSSVDIDMVAVYEDFSIIMERENHSYRRFIKHKNPDEVNIAKLFEESLSYLENPECVILLANNENDMSTLGTVNLRGIKSVWGGVVKKIFVISDKAKPEYEPLWLSLVISGKYVKTWSTFLDENDVNEKDIRSKLMKLKDNLQLYKHTTGFMFSCNGRGANWYKGHKNIESSIFKNIFPDIPLIGCFGYGEFGNCSINANSVYDMKKTGFYREYSTTFMILTYGKINESLKIDDDC